MPLVSVIVPNYNHARYLKQRLDSVFGQTLQDFEVILLDDASTDHSVKVLERYRQDRRVQLILNRENTGNTFRQWDRGLALAKGKYLWIAESDDAAEPRLLETLVGHLERNPRLAVAYCQAVVLDGDGKKLGSNQAYFSAFGDRWKTSFTAAGREEGATYHFVRCTIPNASGTVFRAETARLVGPAYRGYRLCGDHLYWARLMQHGDVFFEAEHLNLFRWHPNTVRRRTLALANKLVEFYRIRIEMLRMFDVPPAWRKRAAQELMNEWVALVMTNARVGFGGHLRIARASLGFKPSAPARFVAGVLAWQIRRRFSAAESPSPS